MYYEKTLISSFTAFYIIFEQHIVNRIFVKDVLQRSFPKIPKKFSAHITFIAKIEWGKTQKF